MDAAATLLRDLLSCPPHRLDQPKGSSHGASDLEQLPVTFRGVTQYVALLSRCALAETSAMLSDEYLRCVMAGGRAGAADSGGAFVRLLRSRGRGSTQVDGMIEAHLAMLSDGGMGGSPRFEGQAGRRCASDRASPPQPRRWLS